MKIVVIGANHAGTTAIRTLCKLNPENEVVVYDKNDNISFLGCGIALWVKGEFENPKGLFYASPELLEQEGAKVSMRHEVLDVDNQNKTLKIKNLDTGEEFEDNYDKLIVALGSWPIIPPIEGIKLDGVKIVKWYQHGQAIKADNENKDIKKVVVCGAGYIGVELVDAFAAAGKEVTLIDICDRIMPNYYDEEFTSQVETAMSRDGVHLATGETVKKFIGENGKATHVVTDKGQHEADLIIWCVGFRPSTQMFKGKLDMAPNGAIIANNQMQTSDKDIYAIGDCATIWDNAKGQNAYIALATTAVRTGIVAGIAISQGENSKIKTLGFQGSNAISIFGVNLASTGMTEGACERFEREYESVVLKDNDLPEFMHNHTEVTIKIVWDKHTRKIIGAQVGSTANHTEVIHMFSLAIQKELTIDELPLLDIFFLPHFNKPYNFITRAALKALGLDLMGKK